MSRAFDRLEKRIRLLRRYLTRKIEVQHHSTDIGGHSVPEDRELRPDDKPAKGRAGPAVTIVIPCFNFAPYVAAAIRSAVHQLPTSELQIVVIDDCSTDSSRSEIQAVVDDIGDAAYIVTYFSEVNRGAPATFNHGVSLAEGRFITFLDADDTLAEGAIAAQLRCFEAAPSNTVVVFGNPGFMNSGGTTLPGRRLDGLDSKGGMDKRGMLFELIERGAPFATIGTLIDTHGLRAVGGFDERLSYCDWPLWIRLCEIGEFVRTETLTGHYRVHGASMSHTGRDRIRRDRFLILADLYRSKRDDPHPDLRSAIRRRIEVESKSALVADDARRGRNIGRAAVATHDVRLIPLVVASLVPGRVLKPLFRLATAHRTKVL